MSRAVLVMDIPDSCMGCNFMHIDEENGVENCQAKEKVRKIDIEKETKPDWCPLHPLPEKKEKDSFLKETIENDCFDGTDSDRDYYNGMDAGWNACIKELTR